MHQETCHITARTLNKNNMKIFREQNKINLDALLIEISYCEVDTTNVVRNLMVSIQDSDYKSGYKIPKTKRNFTFVYLF